MKRRVRATTEVLTIVERGSALAPDGRANGRDAAIVVQGASESPLEVLLAVTRCLISLERRGGRLRTASYVAAPGLDRTALAARGLMVRALLHHLRQSRGDELELSAAHRAADLQGELLALADAVLWEYDAAGVSLGLRFSIAMAGPAGAKSGSATWAA